MFALAVPSFKTSGPVNRLFAVSDNVPGPDFATGVPPVKVIATPVLANVVFWLIVTVLPLMLTILAPVASPVLDVTSIPG